MEKIKVLILGGGFAGMFAARDLARRGGDKVEVSLINNRNYFVFQPLLPEVAAGGIHSSDAVTPLRVLLKHAKFRLSEVIGIDFARKNVSVVQGTRRRVVDLPYDHLIIALGQSADLSRFPGFADHALTMKDLSDAYRLRAHVIGCLENADISVRPEIKKQLLTFVVVGAGFSGTETVGEINEMIRRSLKYYPNIAKDEVRVMLIEYADRILPTFDPKLAEYATKRLREEGVEVLTGVGTKSASATAVELTNGELVPARTIVGTIGNGPNPLVAELGLDMHWGRIKVDRNLAVPGHPNVWAIGDAADIPLVENPGENPLDYAPATAQFAVREATCVSKNIMATIEGKALTPFAYVSKGSLASLGMSKAVAEVYGVKLSGFFAWLVWRAFYLSFLPGWSTKFRVGVNWLMNAIVPPNLVQMDVPMPATRTIHYRKGDIVFEPGMLTDGFYTVLTGKFEIKVDDPQAGQKGERIIGPGQHFGERVILGNKRRTGRVAALEDSTVLWIPRDDFFRFIHAFPMLDDYFRDYIGKTFGPGTPAPSPTPPEKDAA